MIQGKICFFGGPKSTFLCGHHGALCDNKWEICDFQTAKYYLMESHSYSHDHRQILVKQIHYKLQIYYIHVGVDILLKQLNFATFLLSNYFHCYVGKANSKRLSKNSQYMQKVRFLQEIELRKKIKQKLCVM